MTRGLLTANASHRKQTIVSNTYDPQIENHKSVHSEEQALICDGAAIQGGSSKWQGPRENPQGFIYLTMVNKSPEGKPVSLQKHLHNLSTEQLT